MADLNQAGSFSVPADKPTLPSGLKTLTTLTIIGCAMLFLLTAYDFMTSKSALEKMEATVNSPEFEKMPDFAKKMMSPEMIDMKRKQVENRMPLTLISVLGLALCFAGALQMRKLKAQGYILYLAGQILPFIGSIIFLGIGSLTNIPGLIIIAIVLLFIILYTTQRKYLVNK